MSPTKITTELPTYEYPSETQEQLDWADLEALDISKIDDPAGLKELAEQVLRFINKNGFFYVTGHGFTDEEVRRQYAIAKAVFELPLEEKLKYSCDTANGDFRGYKPQSTGELATRDNDERYNIPKFTPEHERPHPQIIIDHLDEIKEFSLASFPSSALERVSPTNAPSPAAQKIHNTLLLPLLRLFAHVLELPDADHFVRRHRYSEPGLEYLRYMLYHPTAAADRAVWARGHTDYNTLTFLFHQPVAGLQVLTPSGAWKHVRSPRDAVIVNIADALEFLSGGYLRSTVHRVVRPPADQLRAQGDRGRLSLIYFARPEKNVVLKPVDSPLLRRIGVQRGGGRSADEGFSQEVTAEGEERRSDLAPKLGA
ncbi:putative flavonol synthase [Diplodia intermedia]|uniref:Flavonol synthase n=1 Tax=Diplodia intermedia TaxID=856260 RepID=A0ABR3TSW2_9PEZI